MLVKACRWATGQPFVVGRRSADLEALDVAWSYSPMGADIYKRLEGDILADFKKLCYYAEVESHRFAVSIGEFGQASCRSWLLTNVLQ